MWFRPIAYRKHLEKLDQILKNKMKNQQHYQGSETSYPPGAPTDPRRCGWKAEEDCFIRCEALRGQKLKCTCHLAGKCWQVICLAQI